MSAQRVLILGAGGHAQVVADALLRGLEAGFPTAPIGYLDDNIDLQGRQFLGLPVLGSIGDLQSLPHDAVIIAIGDNRVRQRLFKELQAKGEQFAIARHPSAVIAPGVIINPGCMVSAGVVINTGSVIGANTILNTVASIDHHNVVGDHVHIAPGSHTGGEVQIGCGVLLGMGAVVLPRHSVGEWSIVGAGAVVCADLPQNVLATGIPARVRRRVDVPPDFPPAER